MTNLTSSIPTYGALFDAERANLPGIGLPWLAERRRQGIERFAATGFPSQRIEDWKFTSLTALARQPFALAPALVDGVAREAMTPHLLVGTEAHLAVFVNGRLRPDLSDLSRLPKGLRVDGLARLLAEEPEALADALAGPSDGAAAALTELNTALMADGAVVRLSPGTLVEAPIHLLFLGQPGATPLAAHPRNLVLAGAGAVATVVETYATLGPGRYWTNAVTRIIAESDATLRHLKLQEESLETFHVGRSEVRLDRGASYHSFVLATGAELDRTEIAVTLAGEHSSCRLDGTALARGRQHLDSLTRIEHASPRASSSETYKNVIDGEGRTVFQGKIRVAPYAQKSSAHQLNQNLLLSASAQADAKPELEILADDVKCSHGATVGDLDHESLFYLRARGLDRNEARALLIGAFVGELIDAIECEPFAELCRRRLQAWLADTPKEPQP